MDLYVVMFYVTMGSLLLIPLAILLDRVGMQDPTPMSADPGTPQGAVILKGDIVEYVDRRAAKLRTGVVQGFSRVGQSVFAQIELDSLSSAKTFVHIEAKRLTLLHA